MPPSTIKCKYYDDDGLPLNARGCYNKWAGKCSYVHPDSPGWDYAERRSYWQHEPPPRSAGSSSSKYSSGKYRSYDSTDSSWGRPPPPPSSSSPSHHAKSHADAANSWSRRSESGANNGGGGASRDWGSSTDLPKGAKAPAGSELGWGSGDSDKGTSEALGAWASGSVSGGDGWESTSAGNGWGFTADSGSWGISTADSGRGSATGAIDGGWGSTTDGGGWGSSTDGSQWPSTAGEGGWGSATGDAGWRSASKGDQGWGKSSKTEESKPSISSKRQAAIEYATKPTTSTASVSQPVTSANTIQSESAAASSDITDGSTLSVSSTLDSTSSLTQDVSQARRSIPLIQKSRTRTPSSPAPSTPTMTHAKPPSLAIDTRDTVIRVRGPRSESSMPESATSPENPDYMDLLYNRPTTLIGRHQAWNALFKEIVRVLYLKRQREYYEAAQDGLRRSGLSEEHSHPGLAARQELDNARRRKDIPDKSDKLRTLQARISKVPLADWPDLDLDQGRQEMGSFVLELKDWVEKVNSLIHSVTRPVRKAHESESPDSRESPELMLPPHARARYQLAEERLNECINDMPVSGGVSLEEREVVQQLLAQDTYDISNLPQPPLVEAKNTVAALREKLAPAIRQTFEFDELRKQNSETLQQLQEEQAAIMEKQNNIKERIERLRARAKRKEGSNIASQVQQLLQEPSPPLALSDDLVKELCSHAIHNVFKLEVIPLLNSSQQELIDSTSLDPSIYQSIWTHLQPAIQLIASIPLDTQHPS